jgi:hypothetical protein
MEKYQYFIFLPSTDMPSFIHRRNRHALHRLRLVTLIIHELSK